MRNYELEFIKTYDRTAVRLRAYIHKRTGDTRVAEDLAAQAFVRAWQALDRYDNRFGSMEPWLFQIAGNLVVDHLRHVEVRERRERQLRASLMADVGEPRPVEAEALARVLAGEIARRLPDLAPREREVMALRFGEGYGYIETAARLGVAENTVKSAQHRAAVKLRGWVGS